MPWYDLNWFGGRRRTSQLIFETQNPVITVVNVKRVEMHSSYFNL